MDRPSTEALRPRWGWRIALAALACTAIIVLLASTTGCSKASFGVTTPPHGDGAVTTAPATAGNAANPSDPADAGSSPRTTGVTSVDPQAWTKPGAVRVSVAPDGSQADFHSDGPSLSADGRYVAFSSQAGNLVPGDTNLVPYQDLGNADANFHANTPRRSASDAFVLDRQTGVMERVSVASDGTQGDGSSFMAMISGDGRCALFQSDATNLVAGDTNDEVDVFVHDRQTGVTDRVSVASGGAEANGPSYAKGISQDGRYVAFMSDADNLVPGDTNGATDVFVRDRVKGTTERVSVSSAGAQANRDSTGSVITADGRYVAFGSTATNLVSTKDTNKSEDIFVRDRVKGTTELVTMSRTGTQANGPSYSPDISDDGRYVSFHSTATNLVAGDTSRERTDVFVYDREKKRMSRESVSPSGKEGNNASGGAQLTPDGRYLIFRSYASNLVKGDTNRKMDIFLRDLTTRTTVLLNLGFPGYNRDGGVNAFTLSADGEWIALTALVPTNPSIDGGGSDYENVFVMRVPR